MAATRWSFRLGGAFQAASCLMTHPVRTSERARKSREQSGPTLSQLLIGCKPCSPADECLWQREAMCSAILTLLIDVEPINRPQRQIVCRALDVHLRASRSGDSKRESRPMQVPGLRCIRSPIAGAHTVCKPDRPVLLVCVRSLGRGCTACVAGRSDRRRTWLSFMISSTWAAGGSCA